MTEQNPSGELSRAGTHAGSIHVPTWAEISGWIGTLLILLAYLGNSMDWLSKGHLYQGMNLAGALGVGLVCWYRRTWQAFTLEAAWGTIALVALFRGAS